MSNAADKPTRPRYLTKSRFKLAVECPRKLYYTGKPDRYPDVMADDDFLAMLAEGGYQVGALAKLGYPDGIEIHETDHAAATAMTQEYLTREHVVLFEPAICIAGFLIRIDILIKTGDRFELIEVKAKSYDSGNPDLYDTHGNIRSAMLPYVQDVAFQTWVLQQVCPQARIKSFLMMPDKARVAPVAGVNQMFRIGSRNTITTHVPAGVDGKTLAESLLAKVDVTNPVAAILDSPLAFPGGPLPFGDAAALWAAQYAADQPVAPIIGAHCASCQFDAPPDSSLTSGFRECWKEALGTGRTATSLRAPYSTCTTAARNRSCSTTGCTSCRKCERKILATSTRPAGVTGLELKQRQWMQVDGFPESDRDRGYYFDAALVMKAMAGWRFPYHYIDFETAAVALPFHAGMRPYQSVAFQFSHHVLEVSGELRHAGQFLCATPGVFPNYDFARTLLRELG